MRSGEEIQAALHVLVDKWRGFSGSEKGEAQSFLNDLVDAYGLDRWAAGMKFERHVPGVGFMDMFWPGRALFEMKAPHRTPKLEDAQPQAEKYWRASADPKGAFGAVRYVVLCSFHRILVWDMHQDPSRPAANLTLEELPEHYEALLFLAGDQFEASFVEHHQELTKDAAGAMARLYTSLKDRAAAPDEEVQRFTLQCVWTLFAEDLGMLSGYPLQTIVQRCLIEQEPHTARDIGYLFRVLNQKGDHNRKGDLAGTTYVNGDLFREPAEVDLTKEELKLLNEAARYDWRRVDPTIFGSLLEGVLGRDRRWELGAHYTHEADIMKIVGPTIVRPWRERIEAVSSPQHARDLLDELCEFRVLDPACGCGNFLYVAYRELRALEAELKSRIRSLAAEKGLPEPPGPWPFVPLNNMLGIDIERVAVLIARVTLWMGHRQMIELYGEAEDALPLVDLSGIRAGDALRVEWPETDCIIGNPPFLGSQWIRGAFGDDYVDWLKKEFGVGVKDFCVYWFRRAQDHLKPGQRAGLVGTNSISQNRARSASLDYVVSEGGVITDAVSTLVWPGDAKVHVSLVNWVVSPPVPVAQFAIDGIAVASIAADLRPVLAQGWAPVSLPANASRCFQGPIPAGAGFVLDEVEARELLLNGDTDYAQVVRRYLTGENVARRPEQDASRWIIDFATRTLEESSEFPAALAIVRERVKPIREGNNRELYRRQWWLFAEPRPGMRSALAGQRRFVAGVATGRRPAFAWYDMAVCPSNLTNAFAFEDDPCMGVLVSRAHTAWAWARASTLKGDIRYTPTSVFATFPWPFPTSPDQRERIGEASRNLLARRSEICLAEQIGLTTLYNRMDEGAYADLKSLHKQLDEAVVVAYGWPISVAQDDAELVRRLTELNREIAEGGRAYKPFAHLNRT